MDVHPSDGMEMRKRSCLTPLLLGSDIEFRDISYSVPEGRGKKGMKPILKSISGRFLPGELTAIMGPSGAGKSTLMNILAGFNFSNVTGDIMVQGEQVSASRFRKMSCYLMQRDELCPLLTVFELMTYAADLKVGHRMSHDEIRLLVNDILERIGLNHAGSTRTALLSGGEKKRLAIALELVNNPPVMFFDEPTTGLDSSTCFQLITLLKALARGGRTVICVIHQPSSSLFDMFDHLYMLAEGRCIYQGQTSDLTHFISSSVGIQCPTYHSPADFAIDVATGKYGCMIDKLADAMKSGNHDLFVRKRRQSLSTSTPDILIDGGWKTNDCKLDLHSFANGNALFTEKNCINDYVSGFKFRDTANAPFWRQVNIITKKTVKCILRDRTLTNVRLLAHIGLGLLTGLIYFGIGNDAAKVYSNVGSLIFGQILLMVTALMTTIITYPLEMPVLIREHLNHWYSLKAYYLAKTVADIPFQIFYPIVYHTIVYLLSCQPLEASRYCMSLLAGIIVSLIAQSIGVAIGAVLNLQGAVFLGPVSTAPQFLFSGFFVSFSTIPPYLRWLSYVMYIRYGFEGCMLSVYGFGREDLDCSQEYCYFRSPTKFLQFFEMQNSLYWVDFVVLVVYYLVVRFLTYFVLRWKLKTKV